MLNAGLWVKHWQVMKSSLKEARGAGRGHVAQGGVWRGQAGGWGAARTLRVLSPSRFLCAVLPRWRLELV